MVMQNQFEQISASQSPKRRVIDAIGRFFKGFSAIKMQQASEGAEISILQQNLTTLLSGVEPEVQQELKKLIDLLGKEEGPERRKLIQQLDSVLIMLEGNEQCRSQPWQKLI